MAISWYVIIMEGQYLLMMAESVLNHFKMENVMVMDSSDE